MVRVLVLAEGLEAEQIKDAALSPDGSVRLVVAQKESKKRGEAGHRPFGSGDTVTYTVACQKATKTYVASDMVPAELIGVLKEPSGEKKACE